MQVHPILPGPHLQQAWRSLLPPLCGPLFKGLMQTPPLSTNAARHSALLILIGLENDRSCYLAGPPQRKYQAIVASIRSCLASTPALAIHAGPECVRNCCLFRYVTRSLKFIVMNVSAGFERSKKITKNVS